MGYFPQQNLATQTGRVYTVSASPFTDGASGGNSTIYYGGTQGYATVGIMASSSAGLTSPQLYTTWELSFSIAGLASGGWDIFVTPTASGTLVLGASSWASTTSAPTARTLLPNGTDYYYITNSNQRVVASIYIVSGATKDWTGSRWISNVNNQIQKSGYGYQSGTWTYASTVVRSSNANTTDGQGRISLFSWNGATQVACTTSQTTGSSSTVASLTGIGVNSTTAYTSMSTDNFGNVAGGGSETITISYAFVASTGFTYIQSLESLSGNTTVGMGPQNISALLLC